jgi:hypothetical protein
MLVLPCKLIWWHFLLCRFLHLFSKQAFIVRGRLLFWRLAHLCILHRKLLLKGLLVAPSIELSFWIVPSKSYIFSCVISQGSFFGANLCKESLCVLPTGSRLFVECQMIYQVFFFEHSAKNFFVEWQTKKHSVKKHSANGFFAECFIFDTR